MSTLTITKKSNLVWLHEPSDKPKFIIGKFTFHIDGDYFQIVEIGQSKRNKYRYSDITIVDEVNSDTFSSFANITELSEKLAELGYLGFDTSYSTGVVSVNGFTGIVLLTGNNFNVTNPHTSAPSSLNQALEDVYNNAGGGGTTPNLQQVINEGNTITDANNETTVDAGSYKIVKSTGISSSQDGNSFVVEDETNEAYVGISISGSIATLYATDSVNSADYRSNKIIFNTNEYPLPTGPSSPLATQANVATAKTEAEDYADGLFDTLVGLLDAKETKHKGIVSSAEKTLVNTTSAQAIYDADLDAEANCAYEIFGSADFTGLAVVSSYLSFSLLGTATIDSFNITVFANKASNNQTQNMSNVSSNATQITSNSAASTGRILFFGTVRVSGAGTVKPSVAFSSATASMKVSANAKFSFNKIGSNTVTNY